MGTWGKALWIALVIACGLVVMLARKNASEHDRYVHFVQRTMQPSAGMLFPTVRVPTTGGDSVVVGQATAPARQLLFVFTTTCPYCRASLPAWRRIVQTIEAAGQNTRILGISLDSLAQTQKYIDEHQLSFPVALFAEGKTQSLYRLRAVPQVILLDHEGRALYTRGGALTETAAVDSVLAELDRQNQPAVASSPDAVTRESLAIASQEKAHF